MELHNLKPAPGKATRATSESAAVQAQATAAHLLRGHKGAKSRSGYKHKVGFEGGQMPLQRRVPKFGFKNINRVEYKAINLDAIEALATAQNLTKITVADLRACRPRFQEALVKILANGAISRALEVQADAFSKKAEEAITAAGGTVSKK